MNKLSLIAFTVAAFSHSTLAETQPAPAPTPAPTVSTANLTRATASLTDAECLAIAEYTQRATLAAMRVYADPDWLGDRGMAHKAMKAIDALPKDGLPDDCRRYMEEYATLVITSLEKHKELSRELSDSNRDDIWEIQGRLQKHVKQQWEDKLALSARHFRGSLMGTGWENAVFEKARQELTLGLGEAQEFIAAHPLQKENKEGDIKRVAAYLQHCLKKPQPALTAAEARQNLERQEIFRHLDPERRVGEGRTFYAIHEGTSHAVRLPHDASTGCAWKLMSPVDESLWSVEWQVVPTASLKGQKPHGEARSCTPLPDTAECAVAIIHLKKPGTVILHFACVQEATGTPIVEKNITFHVRRVDDYRAIMDTNPLPEPEPAGPLPEPGTASLTDADCLAIQRYLDELFRIAVQESAKAEEMQERVPVDSIRSQATHMAWNYKVPRDFLDFLNEHDLLDSHHRAGVNALERKEYEERYGKKITEEMRQEMRETRKKLDEEEKAMWEKLRRKYPRAIIIANAHPRIVVNQMYRSYRTIDDSARQFYAEHPDMKNVSDRLARSTFFRYLGKKRAAQERNLATARRAVERLDALRLLGVNLLEDQNDSRYLYGQVGHPAKSIIFPSAPETGFTWQLESPLAEDAPVQVEWHRMPAERLRKLQKMDIIDMDIPDSAQVDIATIHMKKEGKVKLRFNYMHPADTEALLTKRAEFNIEARDADMEDMVATEEPTPQPQGGDVSTFTDAECLAISTWLHRANAATLNAAADSIEEEEQLGSADFARLYAAEMTDALPADLRELAHAYSELIRSTQEKVAALSKQREELEKAGEEQLEAQQEELFKQMRRISRQYEKELKALKAQYARAAFICNHMDSTAVQEAIAGLMEENEKAEAFLKANPKLKKGKRATAIAWLRHGAAEPQPEETAEAARSRISRMDLLYRLNFGEVGLFSSCSSSVGDTDGNLLPDDRQSGYSWQLATPLPEDSPVQLEWLHMSGAEVQEIKERGLLSFVHNLPTSPDVTAVAVHYVKPGKITLNFVYTRPGEEKPLLSRKMSFEVEANEEDD